MQRFLTISCFFSQRFIHDDDDDDDDQEIWQEDWGKKYNVGNYNYTSYLFIA